MTGSRRVLNVGGGNKAKPIPPHYAGWDHVLLDLDPSGMPDIVCDGRELATLAPRQFDAVLCSHNLEHYHRHEAPRVLAGFIHVLKPDGFAEIRVPDIDRVMKHVVANGLDMEAPLYESGAGPMSAHDVIYGWGREIESSGHDFYAHKTGYTQALLLRTLGNAGFADAFVILANRFEILACAFVAPPSEAQRALLRLPA